MRKRKRGRAGRALPRWDEYFEKWEGGGRRFRRQWTRDDSGSGLVEWVEAPMNVHLFFFF